MPIIYRLFAPVPCSVSINKSSAYHFGPVRVRILLVQNRVMADAQVPVQAAVPAAQALVQPPAAPANVDNPQQDPAPLQVDLLAQLNARIKTLEDAGNDVPAHLSKTTSYGFRKEEDFDKYDALNMAEQLATAAKLSGHEKASIYDVIACTLKEKLPFNKKQFKAYFVALLADKEYAKVLEAVAKVDKSFK